MRLVIQRVSSASVTIDGQEKREIGHGLMVLIGVEEGDHEADAEWLAQKTALMRIFSDDQGKMNRSVIDVGGEILAISQFTLFAQTAKGNRPSFIRSARPEIAIPIYEAYVKFLSVYHGLKVKTGTFGSDMDVAIVNQGPVTITIDSKMRE
jgi:D-tyrosyl-tRNA(Tyr) deacylase